MKNITQKENTEEYLTVLQKFINVTLFGKINNPKFTKGITEIHNTLSVFFQSLEGKVDDERSEFINQFYHKKLSFYRKKLKEKDLIDLMNCFGFSNYRVIKNLFNMMEAANTNYRFNPVQKDSEILTDLIWSKQFPDEIRSYLCMQFFDIFNKIPNETNTITEEQYQYLVDRYVRKYDYNKVLYIVYQNFENVE